MMESREILVLRAMAWERARGELRSLLHTYWSSVGSDSGFERANELITKFIEEFDGDCM